MLVNGKANFIYADKDNIIVAPAPNDHGHEEMEFADASKRIPYKGTILLLSQIKAMIFTMETLKMNAPFSNPIHGPWGAYISQYQVSYCQQSVPG